MSDFPDAVRRAWHLVALSKTVPTGGVKGVTLLGTPIVLFRTMDGLSALLDRCPHRNYPLSLGRLRGGAIECPYHGWLFDGAGQCVGVPGCSREGFEPARLAASPVRIVERWGAIFVSLHPDGPPEPLLPPTLGDPDLDHFWWAQGTWTGRAYDAIENVLDPFHTSHLHHGFIRRRDRRLPVRLSVTSYADGIEMGIDQDRPDTGLMSLFLERDRARSTTRYHPPTIVQARWQSPTRLTLCVTAVFTPSTVSSFSPFACFTTPKGRAPAWLKEAAIRLFLRPVIAQDRAALAAQAGVIEAFGSPRFLTGPGDILGDRLHRLWMGEALAPGADPPRSATL